jgi:hypothetical protein
MLFAVLTLLILGCAHRPQQQLGATSRVVAVSFPHMKFADSEYVQSVEVVIRYGRVVSVNRLLPDWDLKVEWDTPDLLKLSSRARHFVAGLSALRRLDDFITVQSDDDRFFGISATLVTDAAGATDVGGKKYDVSPADMILRPVSNKGGK